MTTYNFSNDAEGTMRAITSDEAKNMVANPKPKPRPLEIIAPFNRTGMLEIDIRRSATGNGGIQLTFRGNETDIQTLIDHINTYQAPK